MIVNGIYQHFKGSFYRVIGECFHHSTLERQILYVRCNELGEMLVIKNANDLEIIPQPFVRSEVEFEDFIQNDLGDKVERFKLIKQFENGV